MRKSPSLIAAMAAALMGVASTVSAPLRRGIRKPRVEVAAPYGGGQPGPGAFFETQDVTDTIPLTDKQRLQAAANKRARKAAARLKRGEHLKGGF